MYIHLWNNRTYIHGDTSIFLKNVCDVCEKMSCIIFVYNINGVLPNLPPISENLFKIS